MLRSTLIAQLLAFLIETQGADLDALREHFPDEFDLAFHASLSEARRGHDSPGLSPAMNESLRFLVARNVVDVTPSGELALHAQEAGAFEDGRGARTLLSRVDLDLHPAPEPVDPLDFEQPRLET